MLVNAWNFNNVVNYYNLFRGGSIEKLNDNLWDLRLGTSDFKYIMINRRSDYQPWVVAFKLDRETATWEQGHYFDDFYKAVNFLVEKQKEIISSYHAIA